MSHNTEIEIPQWMTEHTDYSPKKDNNGFVTKSILSFFKLFRHFHIEKNGNLTRIRSGFRTIMVIGLIVLTALSRNSFFCGTIAAGFLIFLCTVKIDILKRVLSTSFVAALLTCLIMLPSFLLYRSNAFIVITVKVFLSTGMISLYAQITPWNKITGALRFIRVPGFIVFILDLTIHYILVLGNVSYDMLFALKLRSVGKNISKRKSFSGIPGTVFLKSIEMTKEIQQAMECRLFDGKYRSKKEKITFRDFIPVMVLILYLIFFIYLTYFRMKNVTN